MVTKLEQVKVEGDMLHQYSTGDYCESPDSTRHPDSTPLYRPLPRCPRKQYRMTGGCYHQPRAAHSFPNRRIHRSGGRKRVRALEETTSVDEHKSVTSYSSLLTVDVTREMEAVNRDIEEIIRRCDDYCVDGLTSCKVCCLHHHRRNNKGHRGLTQEQTRILSMKRPPLDRLKEVPLCFLKPRAPRHSIREKSLSAPHNKHKTSRDIRDIVEETDALLRNVYKELSRGKRAEVDPGCSCEGTRGVAEPRPATCLERYLGCQNKCRRLQENRWWRPKWKEVFEKYDIHKSTRGDEQRSKHFHDTNCILEPTVSSCLVGTNTQPRKLSKTKMLKDAGVNTDSGQVLTECRQTVANFIENSSREEPPENKHLFDDDKYPVDDLQSVKGFVNYTSDNTSRASRFNKTRVSDGRTSGIEGCDGKTTLIEEEREVSSLLLDRNMGLSLDDGSDLKRSEDRTECGGKSSGQDSVIKSPDTFLSHDYLRSRSGHEGGGDSAANSSRALLSQVIGKIVNKPFLWTPPHLETVEEHEQSEEVDTGTCLEIMKRLVDVMSRHHRHQITDFGEVAAQYARVRKMKQQHLISIEKEINSIQDLEFYLKNASVTRSRAALSQPKQNQ